jgi:FkbM family methyltransferase
VGLIRYGEILRRQKRPVRFLAGQVLMRLGVSSMVRLRQNGFAVRFYPSAVSQALWLGESGAATQDPLEALFRRYLKPGDAVMDAGANIGYYTLLARTLVGDTGAVHAIEAHPRTFRFLQGNLRLNRAYNVRACNVALGDAEGAVRFTDTKWDDQNAVIEGGKGIEVPVRRLDALDVPGGPVALLKIDVEGYELFVLRGAAGMLGRVACVFYESWDEHFAKYRYSAADVVSLLMQAGFEVLKQKADGFVSVRTGHASPACEDLVAVRDAADFVRRTGFRIDR